VHSRILEFIPDEKGDLFFGLIIIFFHQTGLRYSHPKDLEMLSMQLLGVLDAEAEYEFM
jgi:hypothetical protein